MENLSYESGHKAETAHRLIQIGLTMILPVILAGGSGTRLWPLSRELFPKQFLSLVNEATLIQQTVLRLSALENPAPPLVVCNSEHRFMAAEQLRSANVRPSGIILEPVGRNTAPAVFTAALFARQEHGDPVLLVLPADHFIQDPENLLQGFRVGAEFAQNGYLVTFGIKPLAPETGYGYIRKGGALAHEDPSHPVAVIDAFKEKPDRKTAGEYLDSGEYLWNSGMFMFKASTLIKEMEALAPEIAAASGDAFEKKVLDLDFMRLDPAAFSACRSDSIDYAVMEKTRKGVMVEVDPGWNDLGSWEALWQVGQKDDRQNVTHGDVLLHDVENSFFHSKDRLVAAVGLRDHVVVAVDDAVFISPRKRVQDVKHLVNRLKDKKRPEARTRREVYRPWGSYAILEKNGGFQLNRISVHPGAGISLQRHFLRSEHWVVLSGTATVTRGNDQLVLKAGESVSIPVNTPHGLENRDTKPLELIEVQMGDILEDRDIHRIRGFE